MAQKRKKAEQKKQTVETVCFFYRRNAEVFPQAKSFFGFAGRRRGDKTFDVYDYIWVFPPCPTRVKPSSVCCTVKRKEVPRASTSIVTVPSCSFFCR